MSRKSGFEKFIDYSIKEIDREIKREQRESERRYKNQLRENEKRRKIKARKNALEEACQIQLENNNINVDFLSLKNTFVPTHNLLNYKFIESFDKNILILIINYLKIGQRLKAIELLKDKTKLTYNEITLFIHIAENNIYKLIEQNPECWFEDSIGMYEFSTEQKYEIIKNFTNEYKKADIEIKYLPTNTKTNVTGCSPDVVKRRLIKAIDVLEENWTQDFLKYHISRENQIANNLNTSQLNLLHYVIENQVAIFDYNKLKDCRPFNSKIPSVQKPTKELIDINQNIEELNKYIETKPLYENIGFTFFEELFYSFSFLRHAIDRQKKKRHIEKLYEWKINKKKIEKRINEIKKQNTKIEQEYQKLDTEYQKYLEKVAIEKEKFEQKQNNYNNRIEEKIKKLKDKENGAIEEYYINSLNLSAYPIIWEKEIKIFFDIENKNITINYKIPLLNEIYSISNFEPKEDKTYDISYKTEEEISEIYTSVLSQIALRTIYETFILADNIEDDVESIKFNGISREINLSTGQPVTNKIIELEVNRADFDKINLELVDPNKCFLSLKGIYRIK